MNGYVVVRYDPAGPDGEGEPSRIEGPWVPPQDGNDDSINDETAEQCAVRYAQQLRGEGTYAEVWQIHEPESRLDPYPEDVEWR